MSKRATLSLLFVAGLAACSQGTASGVDDLRLQPNELRANHAVTQVAWSPTDEVRHEGVRLVSVWEGSLRVLEYRERVQVSGSGHFALEPIEELTPMPVEWGMRQLSGAAFHHRYRDLAVQDKNVFAENYLLIDQDEQVTVAGRQCARYFAERRDGSCRYDLALDLVTGLCLSYVEYDGTGQERSAMTYESLDTQPDLSGAIWYQPLGETELALFDGGPSELGFAVPFPSRVPANYYLSKTLHIEDGRRDWVKMVFTEGVETLFYLYSPRVETRTTSANLGGSNAEAVSIDARPDEIYFFDFGGVSVAQAELEEGTFIAVGKVAQQELVDLIEFALPPR